MGQSLADMLSPNKTGLKYQICALLVFIYFIKGYWILTALTCIYTLHLLSLLFSNDKVPGGEKWSAVIIGAGFSGIDAAIKLKNLGIPFVIIEKSEKLGGTWWDNQYPGAACDVPSHLYSLSYYLNPWWTRAYSRQEEIRAYLEDVVSKFGLRSYIQFNTRVLTADWQEESSEWVVKGENGREFRGNFLFSAAGGLHIPNDTRFKDDEKFLGPKFHTAKWRHDVQLEGKKVAVIGTGASAVQVVPNIAQKVSKLTVFQRTPAWVPERFDFKYPLILQSIFSALPFLMRIHRSFYFWRNELRFHLVFDNRRTFIMDHVDLITDRVDRFDESGIITVNGEGKETKSEFDVIILATGFSIYNSAVKAYKANGRNGHCLQEEWDLKEQPKAYKCVTHPNYPNMFYCLGPNAGLDAT